MAQDVDNDRDSIKSHAAVGVHEELISSPKKAAYEIRECTPRFAFS